MELKCPSCGTAHQSDDYPGAFEIQCSCGYSILVPDEDALNAPPPEAEVPNYDDSPMAQSEYDEAHKIPLNEDDEISAVITVEETQNLSSLSMTDPEKLPDEMPYDPFEVQDNFEPSHENLNTGFDAEGFEEKPEDDSNSETLSDDDALLQADSDSVTDSVPAEIATPVTAQDVAEKIQLASLGYLLGSKFTVKVPGDLSTELVTGLLDCTDDQLLKHPWLKEHFSHTRSDLEKIIKATKIQAVPELLALEIYLYCLSHEIDCSINASIS